MPGPLRSFAELIAARVDDDHAAILFEDDVVSYRDLVAAAAARADLLAEVRRDGPFHVGVLLENVPEYLFWIAGAALAGAAVVGINPTRRGGELAHDIRHTDCQLIVTDASGAELLTGLDAGVDDAVLVVDSADYGERIARHAGARVPDPLPPPETPLLLLFTSGSTSAPKAVVCSSGRLAAAGIVSAPAWGITRESVTYESMPLFHGNALMANCAETVAVGATVALRRRFSASGFLPDVRRYHATFFNYVGRALSYVLATPEQPDDADNDLQLGFGTEASELDRERFQKRFGCKLIENYGSSEGAISLVRLKGCPERALGKPRPEDDADVAVVDPDTGEECPRARFDPDTGALLNGDEAIGELVRRDAGLRFEGYYNNPDADAERLHDGCFWSGDLGYRDEEGWFYFAGRSSDRLRVDSENFAAAPIERILSRFPGVVMVAVYPVPDPRTGDQVMAALELEPDVEFDAPAFEKFLAAQPDLGTKWAPRFVRVVERMPLTATNKVNKQPLRAQRWDSDDPTWFRPEKDAAYRAMTATDLRELREEFEVEGRGHVLAAL